MRSGMTDYEDLVGLQYFSWELDRASALLAS
jgi:hypothetical protein